MTAQFAGPCASGDDYDEPCNDDLTDEEILHLFLKEGCDLDGSFLGMATEGELVRDYNCPTLH